MQLDMFWELFMECREYEFLAQKKLREPAIYV